MNRYTYNATRTVLDRKQGLPQIVADNEFDYAVAPERLPEVFYARCVKQMFSIW